MRTIRLVALSLCLVLTAAAASAQETCCPWHTPGPNETYEVIQEFPAGGPMQTAWLVHYLVQQKYGLSITGAWFKRSPADPWTQVLYDARLTEIFVPYHDNFARFYDIDMFNWPMVELNAADAGCCGRLLGNPPYVVKEVRDRGVLWKDDTNVRRGQELVLWSAMDAANYNYLFQYVFRDDGSIGLRAGATSRNFPGAEHVAHAHDGLWRIDMDLGGAANDNPMTMEHHETPPNLFATDTMANFNGGIEGSLVWDPLRFTEVGVMDTAIVNGNGKNIGYDLMAMPHGSNRHAEPFSHADFWVTPYAPGELWFPDLPTYTAGGRNVANTDIVLWYQASMHHLPRDEDGRHVNNVWNGVALVMWGGVDLRPRNFFDQTPLFP